MTRIVARTIVSCSLALASSAPAGENATHASAMELACQPLKCSTLMPAAAGEDSTTHDCAYRHGNQWWIDYVAGSLAWGGAERRKPIIVAIYDDGADLDHIDLRDQLWTNAAEASGAPGIDDDGNGYVDDLHGWDFVDDDASVAPEGECLGRASHGTFMASLVAAGRNNGVGIASAGSDGARVMILRIVGCGRDAKDRPDPIRLRRALDYATRMGAKILSFSAHWTATTPELDAAFAEVADRPRSKRAAIVVASVPNKGEPRVGYPAAYPFRRVIRAIPIGNDDLISPGTSAAPPGLNFGAPSACIVGASAAPHGYRVGHGSSNSTAILAGLLAGIWSDARYAKFPVDQFLARVVRARMSRTLRWSQPRSAYPRGVPLADACTLATAQRTAHVCDRQQVSGVRLHEPQRLSGQ